MLVPDHFVTYEGSRLHYAKGGWGPRQLLVFHGFGQRGLVFQEWVEQLENQFTIYAIDLYFHGGSTWPSRKALEKKDWASIASRFLAQEQIERFEVAGFSMGGKFALATLELFPARIDRMVLIAPDGIKTSFWYSLATYPIATRALFKRMITKPEPFFRMIRVLRSLRIVDNGLLRFAEVHMNTEEKRRRVYYSWVYFRHLAFGPVTIQTLLNNFGIPLLVITGRYDRIITTQNMASFLQPVKRHCLVELEAGHGDLVRLAATCAELREAGG